MHIISNFELNKLRNVECTLEKVLRNTIEKFEENKHFGTDILEYFEDSETSRAQESNALKKVIQKIAMSLWSKLDLLKGDKVADIKDFKQFKQEMIDIQESILKTKIAAKSELKKLAEIEDDLSDELNIYYNGTVAEWSEPLNVNMNCEFIPARVKSKNSGQCKEVKQFFDFVHQSGGHENGWRKDDHLLFLKFRTKYKKIDLVAHHLHEVLPDISIGAIKSHEEWYKKYLDLQSKKKDAINRWKQKKNGKNLMSYRVKDVENNNNCHIKYQDDGTKLREKLMQWKAKNSEEKIIIDASERFFKKLIPDRCMCSLKEEREEKLSRDKEFQQQRLLDKIEKERLEKQRQINIKNIVNEWRESKEILELRKRQNKIMFEELEKKRRSTMANKLIKQFQSMDEIHISKMRQIHKKLTAEPPKRVQSGPTVPRDPQRLLQPTVQWAHRVRSSRDPLKGPLPLYAAPKLAIPGWRKSIT